MTSKRNDYSVSDAYFLPDRDDLPELDDEYEELRTHEHPSGTHQLVHFYAIYWNDPVTGDERCHLTGDAAVAESNARAGARVESNTMSVPTRSAAGQP